MQGNVIVCIVGMPGAGKSILSDELVGRGFSYLRFGQAILDRVKQEGLEINENNERMIRERIRKEHGMAALAILNTPKIDELIINSNLVVDGLYSWSEYKVLKDRYQDKMYVVAVYAPPVVRYSRLKDRTVKGDKEARFRSYTEEEARKRDYAEIENIEKGGPIAMADFTIINIRSIDDFKRELNSIFLEIKK